MVDILNKVTRNKWFYISDNYREYLYHSHISPLNMKLDQTASYLSLA